VTTGKIPLTDALGTIENHTDNCATMALTPRMARWNFIYKNSFNELTGTLKTIKKIIPIIKRKGFSSVP
jgi:hypothetical protein